MSASDILTYSLSIFIIGLPFLLKNKFSKEDIVNMVRSFGVFGTFLGILIGLMSFDTMNIEGSVPSLLYGLKTAFLTSLVGLSASIIISLFPKFYNLDDEEEDTDELEIDQNLSDNEKMVLLLTEIRKTLLDNSQNTLVSKLDEVIQQISSSQESIVTNIDKITSALEKNSGSFNNMGAGSNSGMGSNMGVGSNIGAVESDNENFAEMIAQLKGLREDFAGKQLNETKPTDIPETKTDSNEPKKQKESIETIDNEGLSQLTMDLFKIKKGLLGNEKEEDMNENEPGLLTEISSNTDGINQALSMVNNTLRKIQKSQTGLTLTLEEETEKLRLELKKVASSNTSFFTPGQWIGIILLAAGLTLGFFYKVEITNYFKSKSGDYKLFQNSVK